MKFHAVWTEPFNRSVILLAVLLLTSLLSLQASRAATLGVVTAIDRAAGELAIDGQAYTVDSFSQIKQKNTSEDEETAAWYSLTIGDYVIYDARDGRIRSLRREAADFLDRPSARPLDPGSIAPESR